MTLDTRILSDHITVWVNPPQPCSGCHECHAVFVNDEGRSLCLTCHDKEASCDTISTSI